MDVGGSFYVRSLNAHQIRFDKWRAQALNKKRKLLFLFGVLAEVLPQEAVQKCYAKRWRLPLLIMVASSQGR